MPKLLTRLIALLLIPALVGSASATPPGGRSPDFWRPHMPACAAPSAIQEAALAAAPVSHPRILQTSAVLGALAIAAGVIVHHHAALGGALLGMAADGLFKGLDPWEKVWGQLSAEFRKLVDPHLLIKENVVAGHAPDLATYRTQLHSKTDLELAAEFDAARQARPERFNHLNVSALSLHEWLSLNENLAQAILTPFSIIQTVQDIPAVADQLFDDLRIAYRDLALVVEIINRWPRRNGYAPGLPMTSDELPWSHLKEVEWSNIKTLAKKTDLEFKLVIEVAWILLSITRSSDPNDLEQAYQRLKSPPLGLDAQESERLIKSVAPKSTEWEPPPSAAAVADPQKIVSWLKILQKYLDHQSYFWAEKVNVPSFTLGRLLRARDGKQNDFTPEEAEAALKAWTEAVIAAWEETLALPHIQLLRRPVGLPEDLMKDMAGRPLGHAEKRLYQTVVSGDIHDYVWMSGDQPLSEVDKESLENLLSDPRAFNTRKHLWPHRLALLVGNEFVGESHILHEDELTQLKLVNVPATLADQLGITLPDPTPVAVSGASHPAGFIRHSLPGVLFDIAWPIRLIPWFGIGDAVGRGIMLGIGAPWEMKYFNGIPAIVEEIRADLHDYLNLRPGDNNPAALDWNQPPYVRHFNWQQEITTRLTQKILNEASEDRPWVRFARRHGEYLAFNGRWVRGDKTDYYQNATDAYTQIAVTMAMEYDLQIRQYDPSIARARRLADQRGLEAHRDLIRQSYNQPDRETSRTGRGPSAMALPHIQLKIMVLLGILAFVKLIHPVIQYYPASTILSWLTVALVLPVLLYLTIHYWMGRLLGDDLNRFLASPELEPRFDRVRSSMNTLRLLWMQELIAEYLNRRRVGLSSRQIREKKALQNLDYLVQAELRSRGATGVRLKSPWLMMQVLGSWLLQAPPAVHVPLLSRGPLVPLESLPKTLAKNLPDLRGLVRIIPRLSASRINKTILSALLIPLILGAHHSHLLGAAA